MRSSGSSSSMQMSTISPRIFSMSLRIRCVITIRACYLTRISLSCSSMKISFTLSFIRFGNLVKRSAREMIIFAFTPNSMFDCNKPNTKSKCWWQIFELTHMNFVRARMAERSRMHRWGALRTLDGVVYLFKVSFAKHTRIGVNLPNRPSWINWFSVISCSIWVYCSTSASLPPVIWAKSSSLLSSFPSPLCLFLSLFLKLSVNAYLSSDSHCSMY